MIHVGPAPRLATTATTATGPSVFGTQFAGGAGGSSRGVHAQRASAANAMASASPSEEGMRETISGSEPEAELEPLAPGGPRVGQVDVRVEEFDVELGHHEEVRMRADVVASTDHGERTNVLERVALPRIAGANVSDSTSEAQADPFDSPLHRPGYVPVLNAKGRLEGVNVLYVEMGPDPVSLAADR